MGEAARCLVAAVGGFDGGASALDYAGFEATLAPELPTVVNMPDTAQWEYAGMLST